MDALFQIENFNDYQFRSSGIGSIIPNAKTGKMTETMKKYIRKCFVEYVTHQKRQIHSPIFDKGISCEPLSIQLLQDAIFPLSNPKNTLLGNNKERKYNDFVHGELDVFARDKVWEIKNAWDKYTFLDATLTDDYEWQIKSYAWIWGVDSGVLFYTLNNMPKFLLDKEKERLFYNKDYNFESLFDPNYFAKCAELEKDHNYDDWKIYERFKMWEVELTENDIEVMENAVIAARKYMNEILEEEKSRVFKNKILCEMALAA